MMRNVSESMIFIATQGPLTGVAAQMRADGRFADKLIAQPHPLLVTVRQGEFLVVIAPGVAWERARDLFKPLAKHFGDAKGALILLGEASSKSIDEALHSGLVASLDAAPTTDEIHIAVHNALELLGARQRSESRGQWLNRYRYEIGEFAEIAAAINTERDIDKLLELILEKSRFITSADAGSIYVVEGDDPEIARRTLHFKFSQNDSVDFDSSEFSIPISPKSMAGTVALNRSLLNIADVYQLPPNTPYGFDRSFDQKTGYRTKSMLCAPLFSRVGEVIGVIQLINKKRDPDAQLIDLESGDQVIAFDQRSEEVLSTLASQAGISLENAILYAENQLMLEGFVRASVEAIEQRDPTTSGHSRRVAELTVGLAKAVERVETGPYRDVTWVRDELLELEYASLLHDFGKIGVREEVLVKAKKLYPYQLDAVKQRFGLALRSLEVNILQRKLDAMRAGGGALDIDALDRELAERRHTLEQWLQAIQTANEPKVLSGGDFAIIEELARETYTDATGELRPLLTADEVSCLSVPRGSLTPAEFAEIRSHVSHTFEFLSTIPWGRKFRNVAQIAGAHHERLDGTGYPNRLRGPEIPVQSKMMTVADIFDALTARDRPYKRAVPLTRALDILHMEVEQTHIDGELVRIFQEAEVWKEVVEGEP